MMMRSHFPLFRTILERAITQEYSGIRAIPLIALISGGAISLDRLPGNRPARPGTRITPRQRVTPLTFVHKILSVAAVSGTCLFLSGCAALSANIKSYVDPGFTGATIHRLVVFPIRNRLLTAIEAQQLNRDLAKAISRKEPSILIVGSVQAFKLLNENGLADQGLRFLDNYYSSDRPNASVLKKIGQSLGVDAIIQGEIVNIKQTDGVYRISEGTTRATVRYSMTEVKSGKLLWEASSDGSVTTVTTLEPAPPIIYAVLLAQSEILAALPF
jgi:hypothetical protein